MPTSYTFTVTIECDRCRTEIESYARHPEETPSEAIDAFAAEEGWSYVEGVDACDLVCPRCLTDSDRTL